MTTKVTRNMLNTSIDDNGNATAITIDSSENILLSNTTSLIGVNTSDGSDNKSVMINGGGAASDSRGAYVWVKGNEHSDTGSLQLNAGNVSGAAIKISTSGSEKMRIDSSGNVGIGDSNPGAKLDVNTGTVNTLAHFHSTDDNAFIELKDDDTTGYIGVQDDYVYVGGAPSRNDQNIVIHKTSGNVGISWIAPNARLGILQNGSTTPGMNITDGASADFLVYAGYVSGTTRIGSSAGNLAIQSAGSERMRITTGGTILVGKTALDNTTAGIRLNASGLASYTRNGVLLYLNRNTSDGDIIEFAKDNTTIGRIASRGGEFIAVGSGDTNLEFNFGSDQVNPSSGTAARDNAIDLGSSSARFDDIFATNNQINTSDQNEKNTITDSDLGLDFINRLSPKSYKFNGKTRTHYGLIAQDVETVLSDISKPTADFAGFIKGDISEEQDGSSYRYGLRYGEFIAPLIKAIQEQQEQIKSLQQEIEVLKNGN